MDFLSYTTERYNIFVVTSSFAMSFCKGPKVVVCVKTSDECKSSDFCNDINFLCSDLC